MYIISTKTLRLPKDVKAPIELRIHGKIQGAYNEVVVIQHIRRQVFEDAYVCHITEGAYGRGIYDMPGFPFIKEGSAVSINRRGDINFTMTCISKVINKVEQEISGYRSTNWLY